MLNIQLEDKSTKGPVYAQVRDQIEARIRARELAAGEALPSLAALSQQLSVDKGEIQRAYYELELSKLIVKHTTRDFLGKEKTTYTVK